MWVHNDLTKQNFLFYLHLVQDNAYDRFVRSVIDCSRRYEDVYVFNGKTYTGADLRGKGMMRWMDDGLINVLDAQFYVRACKKLFEQTKVKANRKWIESTMKPAIYSAYSRELAEKTVIFISIPDKANELICKTNFDEECWPVPNNVVDQHIEWMLEDIRNAFIKYERFARATFR